MIHLFKKSLFLMALLCLFNSCKDEVGPCEDLEGEIHEELRAIYPYSLNLEGIVFEDLLGQEVVFEVIHKEDKTEVINLTGEFPYNAHFLNFYLHNTELEIYFSIKVFGSYAVNNCPEMAKLSNFVSIRAPLSSQFAASDPNQSSSLIVVDVVDDTIELENPSSNAIIWAGQVFEDVYQTSGNFESYFNFDVGIIGFKDSSTDIDYVYKKLLIE